MTPYDKLKIRYSRLLGEFLGTLEGLDWWQLPNDLRKKLNEKKEDLKRRFDDFDDPENMAFG